MRHRLLIAGLAAGSLASCQSPPPTLVGVSARSSLEMGASATSTTSGTGTGTGNLRATLTNLDLMRGETRDLNALVRRPDGGSVTRQLVWVSSNDEVARVSSATGQLQAVGLGRATLVGAIAGEPESRTAIEINVVDKHAVLLVKVIPATPTMGVGQSLKLKAEVTMADGQINGNVTWTSSDNTIATINQTTGEVSALREGKVTIVAAYSADPRYKGLAEVQILKDYQPTPTPAPEDVVFKPGATPLPGSGSAPAAGPDEAGEDAIGTTVGASDAFKAPRFAAVREFSYDAVYQVIDFRHVVVAEGTKLTVTTNGGLKWTVYNQVGSQPIRAMHWRSPTEGWVAGKNGTVLKVKLEAGKLSFAVKDAGTSQQVDGIYFVSADEGVIASYPARRTTDGGATWDSLGVNGSDLVGDGLGGAMMYNSGTIYHYTSGAMLPVKIEGTEGFTGAPQSADGQALLKGSSGAEWYRTTNGSSFVKVGGTYQTSTQVLRPASGVQMYPFPGKKVLAIFSARQLILSRDGGKLWSDPVAIGMLPDWIKPFSETDMWALDNKTLYRAGTP